MTDRMEEQNIERQQEQLENPGVENAPAAAAEVADAAVTEPAEPEERTWSLGKRIFLCLLYGIILALIFLVAEGAWRDDVVEGLIGIADTSVLGAPLVAIVVALLEGGGRWLMTLRGATHPGFKDDRFFGYLGAGFCITLSYEAIMCLVAALGGGVMYVNVRLSTVICQMATLVIMSILLWKGKKAKALLWSIILYFLWITPLMVVLPGNLVIGGTQRGILTFELVYGAVLCLIAIIFALINRKRTQEDLAAKELAKAAKKEAKRASKGSAKEASNHGDVPLSQALQQDAPQPKAASAEATEENSGSGSVADRYLDHAEEATAEAPRSVEKIEDKYL